MALKRLGDGLGLPTADILSHMDAPEVTKVLAETRALAQRLQISGTPSFVLGREMLRGYLKADQMAAVAAQQRKAN